MPALGPNETDTCREFVVPQLRAAGWQEPQIIEQHAFTDGRIVPTGKRHRRREGQRADYLLEYTPATRVAVVEAKRLYRLPSDGLQQAMRYAEILGVPLAYASNGRGIVEHDYDTGNQRELTAFPSPGEMWDRYRAWRGIRNDRVADALALPFNRELRNLDGSVKRPRYYQRIAIERALQAILEGRSRVLLTLATGSGKTYTALQVVWKLWISDWKGARKPRILYLADRNILVDQPIEREFRPVFGEAIWKIRGEAKMGREIYFALYQSLADSGDVLGPFREYPADYFDLVIVDECHRGSSRDESSWRAILDRFAPAAQLGMTATPLRNDNIDTYNYFGEPVYQYSLAQGIEDGFLAPYRVRRVVLSPDAYGWSPGPGEVDRFGREIPTGVYGTQEFERVVSLLSRTDAAARHLTDFMRQTGRMNKTIVFCVDAEHAEQMRMALHRANADLTRQYPHYVARIVSAEGDVGVEHLDDFVDPERETPVIATTSRLLSTGVDIPNCRNIVLFRPIGSMVEFKQIIGRGTRLAPDYDKLFFEIIDYSGATHLFEDREFDGTPEKTIFEEIDATGEVREPTEVASPEPVVIDVEQPEEASIEDLEASGARKYYVDQTTVVVTAESIRILDPETQRLRIVSYDEYVAGTLRRLYSHPRDLRALWRTRDGRDEVMKALESRGIVFQEIASRTGREAADPFDLLVYLAWNGPLTTRRERANRVRREQAAFLDSFAREARSVLDELLEKYADHGVDELADLSVLEVPPLSRLGSPQEIARRFGGADQLRKAVDQLQELLYVA